MTVPYLKDVSALLALVSAIREGDFERNLQSCKLCLVFVISARFPSRFT